MISYNIIKHTVFKTHYEGIEAFTKLNDALVWYSANVPVGVNVFECGGRVTIRDDAKYLGEFFWKYADENDKIFYESLKKYIV